jgi:hypothetical protein
MTTEPSTPTQESRPAPPRRFRFTYFFAFMVALIVAGHTYLAFGEYRSQLRTVEAMERSNSFYTSELQDRFNANPKVAAFSADPVFTSAEWQVLLSENRKALGGAGQGTARAYGIWWPGLSERAEAALPGVWDRTERVMATGMAMASCHDKALTADERIAQWDTRYGHSDDPYLKDDPYWQAKRAVMPDVITAGVNYFCDPEQPKA